MFTYFNLEVYIVLNLWLCCRYFLTCGNIMGQFNISQMWFLYLFLWLYLLNSCKQAYLRFNVIWRLHDDKHECFGKKNKLCLSTGYTVLTRLSKWIARNYFQITGISTPRSLGKMSSCYKNFIIKSLLIVQFVVIVCILIDGTKPDSRL